MANQSVASTSSPKKEHFRWVIEDYSHLRDDPQNRYYSPIFCLYGYTWRILLFPDGNTVPHTHVSAFLEVAEQHLLPTGWRREATFVLNSVNLPSHAAGLQTVKHTFTSKQSDWGFRDFIAKQSQAETRNLLKDDILILDVSVETHAQSVLPNPSIDQNFPSATRTLKESGFAGPQSACSTQYLNSVLMTLFHLAFFRRRLYALDTSADDQQSSPRLCLQRIFFLLQQAQASGIDQTPLLAALARSSWHEFDAWHPAANIASFLPHLFTQIFAPNQDDQSKQPNPAGEVPEIHHIFIDLESLKQVSSTDPINSSSSSSSISNSTHQTSSSPSSISALQSTILEMSSHCDGGFLLPSLPDGTPPPVLFVHLQRFATRPPAGLKHKLTRFFDYEIALSFGPAEYHLHAVLAHSGAVHGGHYHCFIRPSSSDPRWFKFDDELVSAVEADAVFEDNFGGRSALKAHAYLLVYVHAAHAASGAILAPLADTPVPEALQQRFQAIADEERSRHLQRAQALLYMDVRVATVAELLQHNAQDGEKTKKHGDLVDFECVPSFRVKKSTPLRELKLLVERELGVPSGQQRFWTWMTRENGTYRPDEPILKDDSSLLYDITTASVWELFLENTECASPSPVSLVSPVSPSPSARQIGGTVLLLLKQYDPEAAPDAQKVRFVGTVSLDKQQHAIRDLVPACQTAAGLPLGAPLLLFEEVNPHLVLELSPQHTLDQAGLQNGDIIVFQHQQQHQQQQQLQEETGVSCREYYKYLAERVVVSFSPLPSSPHANPQHAEFSLELRASQDYAAVAAAVAQRLGASDVEHVRLTGHNPMLSQPRSAPHLPSHAHSLRDILQYHCDAGIPILYYEVVPFTMKDYEDSFSLRVEWRQTKRFFEVLTPKSSVVKRALHDLQSLLPEAAEVELDKLVLSPINPRTGQSKSPISHATNVANMNSFLLYRVDTTL